MFILWDGEELVTTKSGSFNSKGGVLLTAFIPELNTWIEHRSNGEHGRKGFSYGATNEVFDTQDHPALPSHIRQRLSVKY